MPKTQHEISKQSSVPGPIIPENTENQQKNSGNQQLLTVASILPADQGGEFFFISGVAFPNRESALKRVEKFQKEQKNCFISGAAYSRKEEKIQFATRLTGFSLNFNSKVLFDSSQALLSFLPEGVVCPDGKGCVYVSWLFDRECKVEDTDALFSELKEIFAGRATVTPRIPWNSYSRKEKFPGEVSLKQFEMGLGRALDKLMEAKGLKKPANMALEALESLVDARNDSGDKDVAVEEIEVFISVVEGTDEQGMEVGMEAEQEIMGGNKCSFASAKSLDEVKVSLSIYSGYYESEPVEQKLGVSVAQALDFVLQQGHPKVTTDKFKAPYWAGEMKESAWKGKTKKKKDAALAEVQNKIEGSGFVPVTEGVQRSADHCVGASLVKLDLDEITAGDFEAVKSKIEASGLEARIYTTHSHGVEGKGNRYRVVFVLDRQASVAEFEAVSEFIGLEMLGRTYDASEHKAYQLAGVWAVHPDRESSAQYWRYTGAAVSVDKVLALAVGAGCQGELVSPIGVGSGTCELTKSLMNSNLESKDPLPVWDDACYQTLKDALTHSKIHENHSPDQNPTQVKVLAALLKSVEVTQQKYPDQAVVAEERCKALYVAYASGNRRGYDLAQIEKDWGSKAIGGMYKFSPFYIVGIAQGLGFDCDHITGKGMLPSGVVGSKAGTGFNLRSFSLKGQSQQMKKQMLDDVYVLEGLALMGQFTAIAAPPGSGKTLITLKLLIDAVKAGRVNPDDIFYINADDNFKGIVEKIEVCEAYGINMLAPGQNGFTKEAFQDSLTKGVAADEVQGQVIIIDTYKKYTDIMDKKVTSAFNDLMRQFVSKGGTVIAMLHVNKHQSGDGKNVMAGTTDVRDDSDCCFVIDVISDTNGKKTVEFRNEKMRGNVEDSLSFEFDKNSDTPWTDKLKSVALVGEAKIAKAKKDSARQKFRKEHEGLVETIIRSLSHGATNQTEITNEVHREGGINRKKVAEALKLFEGPDILVGDLWTGTRGDKNASLYKLHPGVMN